MKCAVDGCRNKTVLGEQHCRRCARIIASIASEALNRLNQLTRNSAEQEQVSRETLLDIA